MRKINGTVTRGAIAGLIGAAALAIWFLIIDTLRSTPFYTPTFVASALLGLENAQPTPALIAIYTGFHFFAFVLIGVAVNWALEKAHIPPFNVLGIVLGFMLFDLIFYAGVIVTGTNVITRLGWPSVLAGNMIAGVALTRYLWIVSPYESKKLREVLAEHRTTREGLVAGALGATIVMAWFLGLDLIERHILFTPAALGSAVFYGARSVDEVRMTVETVIGYTGLHIIAFLAVGITASALVEGARRSPPLLLGVVLFFVTLEVMFIGLLAIVAMWLLNTIHWWTIVVGNLIAAAVIAGYLLYEHPEMRENLTHDLEEELAAETAID